jgi:hypothetical protein
MALALFFMGQQELQRRMRAICFAFLTPFYFLKAGSLIEARALIAGAALIALFLSIKIVTKLFGILPSTRYFNFKPREGVFTTLMMSTGLTFGSIWPDQSHHRSNSIHRFADGGHRQRRGAHANCAGVVSAAFRAAGGRRPANVGRSRPNRGRHAGSERRRHAKQGRVLRSARPESKPVASTIDIQI